MRERTAGLLWVLFAASLLAACGGSGYGGGGGTPGVPGFTVGGSLSGLGPGKSISLQMNGGDAVTASANGAYSFAGPFQSGFAYTVALLIQPLGQNCTLSNPSGIVGSGNVTNIAVTCTSNQYSIGGTVSGLTGGGGTLQNNAGDDLSLSNGAFAFGTPIADSAPYAVTVSTQPTGQICTVNNGRGTVSAANVNNVAVICSASAFTVGGNSGSAVVLQNNGADNLTAAAGAFTFATPLASGAGYSVGVLTPPAGQGCSVANGSGTIGANVTNVAVACAPNQFTVGGTVSGLSGTLVVQNNLADALGVSANGPFVFATAIATGSAYAVSVLTQPAGQTCVVANASGTVSGANVSNVAVSCGVPDLIPVNATFAQQAGLNKAVAARLSAGNAGTVASPPITVTVRLHADAGCVSAPAASLSADMVALGPSTVASAFTPSATIAPGTYPSQSLIVDPANNVAESNEANNTLCLTNALVVH